ncbi:hypothetical protein BpHYR1_051885 [Brachionus plicatilis]|uniref:Uncharacterized protein n=1 Tax=Brachionus plicatilis TaxID=10195 RepID=A0A3M7RM22_BRAPC|nr:hypothetical protein BpHYR1_051885 [Brachionus plicatilis]
MLQKLTKNPTKSLDVAKYVPANSSFNECWRKADSCLITESQNRKIPSITATLAPANSNFTSGHLNYVNKTLKLKCRKMISIIFCCEVFGRRMQKKTLIDFEQFHTADKV